jgi:hypothetical protein
MVAVKLAHLPPLLLPQVLQLGSENARLQEALKRTEAERDSANKQLDAAQAQLGAAGRDSKPAPRSGAASPVSPWPPPNEGSPAVSWQKSSVQFLSTWRVSLLSDSAINWDRHSCVGDR